MLFSQYWTHFCAVSLQAARSSAVHTCSNKGHWSKCCMVWGPEPQSQFRSWLSFKYPHLWRSTLQCPMPVLSLLRHFHSVHICSAPAGSSSQGLSAIGETGERSESLSSHVATLILSGVDVGRGSKPQFSIAEWAIPEINGKPPEDDLGFQKISGTFCSGNSP